MKVDAVPLFIAGLSGAPAGAAKAETPFAQVLAEGALDSAIIAPEAAAASWNSEASPGRDDATGAVKPLAVPAFAFGALGMFAPRRDSSGIGAAQDLEPAAGAIGAAAIEARDGALSPVSGALSAPVALRVADTAATPAQPSPPPVGSPARQNAHPSTPLAPSPAAPPADAESEGGLPGAAPRSRAAASRRATAPSLTIAERDGRLSVVAGVSAFDPSHYGEARARLAAAAADLGATLEDLHINGQAGPAPVRGGPRHGHRAR